MGDLGAIVVSGQLILAIPIAILAGLVSFASPCVLPLVPGYIGYVGGTAEQNRGRGRGRAVAGVALFIAGFSLVFIAYGVAFGTLGTWLIRWQDVITRIVGVLVILMGLVFIGLLSPMQRTFKLDLRPPTGLAGAPMLGIVFGVGWTPCLGPTLAAISLLSLDSGSAWRGALLGFAYCVGLGLPFLLIALGFDWMLGATAFLRRHIRFINIFGGIMLVVIGILMVTGVWTAWIYSMQSLIGSVTLPI
ncbi:cytochrome C biogenesis protein [Leifsonia sp. Leaf325]|nr:cytochrome c biogenesis protein CcdA [Leifsonia sp. Leaf325]KQQ92561.1 cytochrome C biogenesis protein [Leifsonia sp. Leaf325]